jgi:hypothetical protein
MWFSNTTLKSEDSNAISLHNSAEALGVVHNRGFSPRTQGGRGIFFGFFVLSLGVSYKQSNSLSRLRPMQAALRR